MPQALRSATGSMTPTRVRFVAPVTFVDPVDDGGADRKTRGAFFTADVICSFITAWAVRSGTDRVLEPACGEAAFLAAAASRFGELNPGGSLRDHLWVVDQVHGVE